MSNTDLIIPERSRDIGDFLVGRLIPFRKKRMVGPFIFIDHMGPSKVEPEKYLDVDQHPHIGLSTLTYLLEGNIVHADSLGTKIEITPGSVNWMTAGKGVTHTERTPNHQRGGNSYNLNGYQIWVALPKNKEDISPSFHHFAASDLPSWETEGAKYKLIAGEGFGRKSPVPVFSPLFMVEIITNKNHLIDIKNELQGEIGIVVCEGKVIACDNEVDAGNMLVSKTENACKLKVAENSRIYLFGGEPFDEERHIFWNFVSHSKEVIDKAKEDWKNKKFPTVPNDDSYVPLP
jgi:redox-sensitive bicupin YhaK (pirin superfamily)